MYASKFLKVLQRLSSNFDTTYNPLQRSPIIHFFISYIPHLSSMISMCNLPLQQALKKNFRTLYPTPSAAIKFCCNFSYILFTANLLLSLFNDTIKTLLNVTLQLLTREIVTLYT